MRLKALTAASGFMFCIYGGVGLIGVGAIRLFTELAPPAVFGEANLLLTLLGLAVTVSSQPFTNTQLRFHSAAARQGRGDGYTRAALLWTTLAGSGVYALAILGWLALKGLHDTSLGPVGVAGLGGIVMAASVRNVLYGRYQAEGRNLLYGGLLAAEAAVIAAGTAGGLWVRASLDGYVAGHAIGLIGAAALGLLADPRGSVSMLRTCERAPEFLRQARSYGAPFAPIGVLGWLANLADRYVLGALAGPAAVGRYVAPFSIASRGMGMFGGALNDIFRPALFAATNADDRAGARRIFTAWLAVRIAAAAGGVAGLALAGPLVARLLLAPAYRDGAAPILTWIAAAYGVQGVIQTLETALMARDRTGWLIGSMSVGGGLNLIFSLMLIPRCGALGAAQATTASFLAQAALTVGLLCLSPRSSRLHEPAEDVGAERREPVG